MTARGLKQADLAEILGVPIDRVKSITAGRVKKFSSAESKALVEKLHVRGDWLATGEGPMFQADAEQAMSRHLNVIKETSTRAAALDLPIERQVFVRDVLYGVAMNNAGFLNVTIDGFLAMHGPSPSTTPSLEKGKRS